MKNKVLFIILNIFSLDIKPLIEGENSVKNNYIVVLDNKKIHLFDSETHISKLKKFIENEKSKKKLYSYNKNATIPTFDSKIIHVFDSDVIIGYSGEFDPSVLAYIRSQPDVAFVETDERLTISNNIESNNTASIPTFSKENRLNKRNTMQYNAPWGLSRITKRANDNSLQYPYDPSGGKGVVVYVIDSGINIDHVEFEGRARLGVSYCPNSNTDTLGHGTHVAGTIGSKSYGVAKKVDLVSIQISCGAQQYRSWVLNGILWAVKDFNANKHKYKAAVMNLSIHSDTPDYYNKYIEYAYNNGILPVASAGNKKKNACDYSPASSKYSLTVGATNDQDKTFSHSNYGPCVNIYAPGEVIESTYIGSDTATARMSGTSMAAPHVSGAAAYYASKRQGNSTSPTEMWSDLVQNTSNGYIHDLGPGSSNYLLYLS